MIVYQKPRVTVHKNNELCKPTRLFFCTTIRASLLCEGGSKELVVRMYNLVIVKYGECGKRRVGLFVIWIIKFQQVSVCSTKFLSMSGVMSLEI